MQVNVNLGISSTLGLKLNRMRQESFRIKSESIRKPHTDLKIELGDPCHTVSENYKEFRSTLTSSFGRHFP